MNVIVFDHVNKKIFSSTAVSSDIRDAVDETKRSVSGYDFRDYIVITSNPLEDSTCIHSHDCDFIIFE